MEQVIALRSVDEERVLLGARDRLRRMLGQRFGVEVVSRGGQLRILGQDDAVAHAHVVVLRALEAIRRGVDEGVVERILFEASVPEKENTVLNTPAGVILKTEPDSSAAPAAATP